MTVRYKANTNIILLSILHSPLSTFHQKVYSSVEISQIIFLSKIYFLKKKIITISYDLFTTKLLSFYHTIMFKISNVHAREVLDSRGNPTVEVEVTLDNGVM
jgi:hypothetical protein